MAISTSKKIRFYIAQKDGDRLNRKQLTRIAISLGLEKDLSQERMPDTFHFSANFSIELIVHDADKIPHMVFKIL